MDATARKHNFTILLLVTLGLALGVYLTVTLLPARAATASHQTPNAGTGSMGLAPSAYLPIMLSPDTFPPLPEISFQITPEGGINASTYNTYSFRLENHPDSGQRITQVRIDLSSALFPDMVFDPYGLAGDLVAKDLTIDFDTGVGFAGYAYEGFHHDGYDIVVINFSQFDPSEQFSFSVDVDPTSIRGVPAPGPGESGSVSGLELTGATLTATFDSGLVLVGQTFRAPGSTSGSQLILRDGLPVRPTVAVLGVPFPPATVTNPNQVLRISGPANQHVKVLVVQGALFTAGLPGGGFDIQPYEANSALEPGLQEFTVYMPGTTIDIPITLARTLAEGGLNHITVVFENGYGMPGLNAEPIVLELQN